MLPSEDTDVRAVAGTCETILLEESPCPLEPLPLPDSHVNLTISSGTHSSCCSFRFITRSMVMSLLVTDGVATNANRLVRGGLGAVATMPAQ